MKSKIYLFAYGTLRKAFGLLAAHQVENDLLFVGSGLVNARLYDLGSYPGAVRAETDEVEGDVFAVLNEEKVFRVLDEYEGEEYGREQAEVTMDSGENVLAWIYWYNGQINEQLRITEKDYRLYLKTKDSLR